MKRILITGANSYIGTSFENYIKQFDGYEVDTVDMIDSSWRQKDFSNYDVVFHVAGIAHIKETKKNADLYYKINRDLAYETAQKAKNEGVGQFVFLSSMSVYGMDTGIITKETVPTPKSNYGKSKLQAEHLILGIADNNFNVCVIRPPMVYGRACKGNYQTILKIVRKSPVFPNLKNQRSMIYIGNLNSFVEMCINKNVSGIYCPQNREYVQTSHMVELIAKNIQKKIYLSVVLGIVVNIIKRYVCYVRKAFGNLVYMNMEDFEFSYCITSYEESIKESL